MTCTTGQKAAGAVLFIALAMFGSRMACSVLWPSAFPSADDFAHATISHRGTMLAAALSVIALGVYFGWTSIRFELRLDQAGVHQFDGFRRHFVGWSAVSSYTMERTGSFYDGAVEPILRGADGQPVLRPLRPPVVHGSATREARALFWQRVTEHIDKRNAALRVSHI